MHTSVVYRFRLIVTMVMCTGLLGSGVVSVAASEGATPLPEPMLPAAPGIERVEMEDHDPGPRPPSEPASMDTPAPAVLAADTGDYTDLLLLFTENAGEVRTYPGQLCVQVSVNPPLYLGSWVGTMCENHSPETTVWHSSEYASLPVSSSYTATVVSNSTGCTATPQPGVFQEFDSGFVYGRMTVVIDCHDAPERTPTATVDPVTPEIGIEYPTHVPTATRTAAVDEYYALRLLYEDVSSVPVLPYPLYAGDLCIQVTADPPLADTGVFVPLCAHVSPIELNWFSSAFVHLPLTTTYTATILSNETGCEVTIHPFSEVTWRDRPTGEFVASINCDSLAPTATHTPTATTIPTSPSTSTPTSTPVPDDYGAFGLRFDDLRGGDYTYRGQLCIKVIVTPPLHSDPTVGELCSPTASRSERWVPAVPGQFPRAGTYTATIVSNETGCEVEIDPAVIEAREDATLIGEIQVWIDCGSGTETPIPTVITTTTATATSKSGETPVARTDDDSPAPPTAAAKGSLLVTGLPKTGSGRVGRDWQAIVAGASILFLFAGVVGLDRRRGR